MRALLIALMVVALSSTADAQETPRVVNVTTDSEPGWIPSVDQDTEVANAVRDYFAAQDSGRYQDAYALQAPLQQTSQTPVSYAERVQRFNDIAGRVREHRTLVVTWTKNPAQAPLRGVYAAVDVASTYENIDRECGYLVFYQPNDGGPFLVMREETNFISNADAALIERQQSRAALDAIWAQLSANCPNYAR